MRDILNATTLRQLTFLEYLVSQEQWVTVDKVAEAIHCSARSLHSDIQVINQLYGPFRIEVSIKRGISLSYPPKYGIDFIYATVLETSPEFGLLEWLFWHESCQLDDLCRALFSSESTIKRMIRRINQVLLLRGLQISGPPYNMIGSEQSLRRFYSLYFSERYLGEVPLMTAEKRAVLNELIQMVTGILDVDCSTVNLNRVEVLISLIRYRNGYFTETECLSRANQERLKQLINEVMSSQGLVEHFQHQFQFEVTDGVLREVLMDYFNREYATSPTHLLTTLLKNPKVKAQVARMADFLVQLANQLAIELRDYQRLLVEFYNVMRGATSVSYILFDKNNNF